MARIHAEVMLRVRCQSCCKPFSYCWLVMYCALASSVMTAVSGKESAEKGIRRQDMRSDQTLAVLNPHRNEPSAVIGVSTPSSSDNNNNDVEFINRMMLNTATVFDVTLPDQISISNEDFEYPDEVFDNYYEDRVAENQTVSFRVQPPQPLRSPAATDESINTASTDTSPTSTGKSRATDGKAQQPVKNQRKPQLDQQTQAALPRLALQRRPFLRGPGVMLKGSVMHPLAQEALFRRRQGILPAGQIRQRLPMVNSNVVRNRIPGDISEPFPAPNLRNADQTRQASSKSPPKISRDQQALLEAAASLFEKNLGGPKMKGKLPPGMTRKDVLMMAEEFLNSRTKQQPSHYPGKRKNKEKAKERMGVGGEIVVKKSSEKPRAVPKKQNNDVEQQQQQLLATDEKILPWISIADQDSQFKTSVVMDAAIDGSIQHAYTIMDAQRSLVQEKLCDLYVLASAHNLSLPLIDADLLPDHSFILHEMAITKGLHLAAMVSQHPPLTSDILLARQGLY